MNRIILQLRTPLHVSFLKKLANKIQGRRQYHKSRKYWILRKECQRTVLKSLLKRLEFTRKKSFKSLNIQKEIHVFTPFHIIYKIHLGNLTVTLAIKFPSKVMFDSYEVVALLECVSYSPPKKNLQKKNKFALWPSHFITRFFSSRIKYITYRPKTEQQFSD